MRLWAGNLIFFFLDVMMICISEWVKVFVKLTEGPTFWLAIPRNERKCSHHSMTAGPHRDKQNPSH